MALRRPALEAGRLSIRRVPLPRYKLGSQICSISVSCALSDGNQAGRELSSEPEPMGRQNEKGSAVWVGMGIRIKRELSAAPGQEPEIRSELRARGGGRCVAARSKKKVKE